MNFQIDCQTKEINEGSTSIEDRHLASKHPLFEVPREIEGIRGTENPATKAGQHAPSDSIMENQENDDFPPSHHVDSTTVPREGKEEDQISCAPKLARVSNQLEFYQNLFRKESLGYLNFLNVIPKNFL